MAEPTLSSPAVGSHRSGSGGAGGAVPLSEQFFQATLDALSAPIAILDVRGVILAVNRAWLEADPASGSLFGQVVGVDYPAACEAASARRELPAGQGDQLAAVVRRVLHGEVAEQTLEYAQSAWAGTSPAASAPQATAGEPVSRWYALHVTRFEQEELVRVVVAHEDVTRGKRAELEAERRAQELTRSNRDLEQFAYVASHDLQEPLRMVVSYLQLLERRYKGKLDQDADEFIAYAVDGARRMQRLISDLLTYSRVGRSGAKVGQVELDRVAQRALESLAAALQESGAAAEVAPLPVVWGDSNQLTQLFQNLLANAIKFRRDVPLRIRIWADQGATDWTVHVQDNGIGIERPYLERIFVLFQRLHGRGEYPGTGIGLALCRKIVEWHGGQIRVDSTPGEGSTFSFTLPKKNPQSDESANHNE